MMLFRNLKYNVFMLLIAFTIGNLNAQNRNLSTQHSLQHRDLIAGQQNIHKQINLVDSLAFIELLEEEAAESPAWDVYGDNWSPVGVNPYKVPMDKLAEKTTIDVSEYSMPVKFKRFASKYGWRQRFRRMHRGVDLSLNVGDTIRAAFSGKVRLTRYERRGYGYYVIVRHHNGLETVYGHLSKFLVEPNQIVKAGEPIALGGNTGRSTGPHLHFETRYLGMDIDPEKIFDFTNLVTHTDTYTFSPKQLAASLGYGNTTGVATAKYAQAAQKAGTQNGKKYVSHRIRKGDTLGKIAKRYGVSINQLCRLNGYSRTTTLRPGKVLRVR